MSQTRRSLDVGWERRLEGGGPGEDSNVVCEARLESKAAERMEGQRPGGGVRCC